MAPQTVHRPQSFVSVSANEVLINFGFALSHPIQFVGVDRHVAARRLRRLAGVSAVRLLRIIRKCRGTRSSPRCRHHGQVTSEAASPWTAEAGSDPTCSSCRWPEMSGSRALQDELPRRLLMQWAPADGVTDVADQGADERKQEIGFVGK